MNQHKKIFPSLKYSIETLFQNKIVFFPYLIIVFLQLLLLELLFFAPRFPIKIVYDPIVKKLWSANYLHYPLNFVMIQKMYHGAQVPFFVLISSFFVACSIAIIQKVNKDEVIKFGNVMRETLKSYVHVAIAAALSVAATYGFFYLYGKVLNRALMIRSETGIYALIKKTVIIGEPYFSLLMSILATFLFVYMIPIIIIDKKNVFKAFFLNFKSLFKSFWFTLCIIFIPTLFYTIVLLLRGIVFRNEAMPELSLVLLIVSIFVMTIIDAVVYTAVSIHYLLEKERT